MKKLLLLLALVVLTACGQGTSHNRQNQFVVGMECNYAPFNWTTLTKTDTSVDISGVDACDGYDVVVSSHLAKELGKELVIKKIAWSGLEPALSSGEIDAIIAGMSDTPMRRESVDFTQPYYASQMVMLVRKGDPLEKATSIQDFKGKKVLGQINTLYDDVIDQIDGVIHATPLDTYPLMLVALQSKEVDALTAEEPVAKGVLSTNPDLSMVTFDQGKGFEVDTSVSIAVKKGNKDLLDALNKALDKLDQDQRDAWMVKASQSQPAGQ